MAENQIAVRGFVDYIPTSIDGVLTVKARVAELLNRAMTEGVHYGAIPGTPTEVVVKLPDNKEARIPKRNLLKPGAETICVALGLVCEFRDEEKELGDDHLEIVVHGTLKHAATNLPVGYGIGSCTSKETRYAYRTAAPKCPTCEAEAIKRSKFPPRHDKNAEPGWYCFDRLGGCGAQFDATDKRIVDQPVGRQANPDIADLRNTVRKMAFKRCHVDTTIRGTGASDFLTQDLDDFPEFTSKAQQQQQPKDEPKQEAPKQESQKEQPKTEPKQQTQQKPAPQKGRDYKLDPNKKAESKPAAEQKPADPAAPPPMNAGECISKIEGFIDELIDVMQEQYPDYVNDVETIIADSVAELRTERKGTQVEVILVRQLPIGVLRTLAKPEDWVKVANRVLEKCKKWKDAADDSAPAGDGTSENGGE